MNPIVFRAWVNQPSTLQPQHALHGTRVLAVLNPDRVSARIYFLGGSVVSQEVSMLALARGWPDQNGMIPAPAPAESWPPTY